MKRGYTHRESTDAGAIGVPFQEFTAPLLYIGEAVAPWFTAVFNAIERGIDAVNRWRWARVTKHTLSSLDDRTLADIGVQRSEIPAVARFAASEPTYTPTFRSPWVS